MKTNKEITLEYLQSLKDLFGTKLLAETCPFQEGNWITSQLVIDDVIEMINEDFNEII